MIRCKVCFKYINTYSPSETEIHRLKCTNMYNGAQLTSLRQEQQSILEKKKASLSQISKELSTLDKTCYPCNSITKQYPSIGISAYMAEDVIPAHVEKKIRVDNTILNSNMAQSIADMSSRNFVYDIHHQSWNHDDQVNEHLNEDIVSINSIDTEISSCSSTDSLYDDRNVIIEQDSNASVSRTNTNSNEDSTKITELSSQYCLLQPQSNIGQARYFLTPRHHAYIELASILTSINAPLHVYKSIYKWAQKTSTDVLNHPIQYRTLIKNLAYMTGLEGTFPKTSILPLPSGNMVKVTKFGFASQLLSVLEDKDLMRPENLIYGDNLFKRFHEPNDIADDIETSQWFIRTQNKLCKEDNDVLCPLIFYVDKTFSKGKAIEPIVMCLGESLLSAFFYTPKTVFSY